MSFFTGDDLVFYQDNKSGNIMSGGYNINSILLKEGIAPMTTYNTNLSGGSKLENNNNISSIFDNLAVPAGLFYYDQKAGSNDQNIEYKNTEPISEDLHDKLFKLVEINNKKKQKTYKNKKDKGIKIKNSRKNIKY